MLRRLLFALAITLTLSPLSAFAQDKLQTAIYPDGCFWCVEADFDKVPVACQL